MVNVAQPGILAPAPHVGRYLFFSTAATARDLVGAALRRLASQVDDQLDLRAVGL